jgi:DNA polymerase I
MIVDFKQEREGPVIHIYYRDLNRERKEIIVKDYHPYFYVPIEESSKILPYKWYYEKIQINEYDPNTNSYKEFYSIDGKKLAKIVYRNVYSRSKLKDIFKETYELDVPFITKFMVDRLGSIPSMEYRKWYLDIEVVADKGFPDVSKAEEPISCITIYDSFSERFVNFVWRQDLIPGKEEKNNIAYFRFNNEKTMLNGFIELVAHTNPDILTGWNVEFDIKYLLSRMERLGCPYQKLSPLYEVDSKYSLRIKGRIIIDLLMGYRKLTQHQLESYKLDFVAEKELGQKKIVMDKMSWKDKWMKKIDELVEYNIKDVDLTKKLDDKIKITDFLIELRDITKCEFENLDQSSKVIESYILERVKGKVILPSVRSREEKSNYEGGFVMDPVKGIHKNVMVFDVQSLYPSIIMSMNMSPETLLNEYKEGCINIDNKYFFDKNRKGVIPDMLEDLFQKRKKYKEEMKKYDTDSDMYNVYNKKQYAIKIILNATYGVMAFDKFRLYNKKVAEAVTYTGRKIISFIIEKVRSKGYEVLYSDTDSVFVKSKKENIEEVIEEGLQLQKIINDGFNEITSQCNSENKFFINFEKIFKSIFFSNAKKRYAGIMIWKDGRKTDKLVTTGFETIRTDTSKLGKEIQNNVFKMVLNGSSEKEVVDYIKMEVKKIKNGEYSIEQIAIPKGISKKTDDYDTNVAHIRAVKYSNQYLGTNFMTGDKPKVLWIKDVRGNYPKTDIVCIEEGMELPKEFIVDRDAMAEKIVHMKIRSIFENIGWSYSKVEQDNYSLSDFI